MRRLHIHGVGTLARGADEPFAEGIAALETIPIEEYTKPAFRRRFGRLSRLCYVAASRALEDAGVDRPEELGLVSSTALGEATVTVDLLSQIHASRGALLRPGLVPNSVHSAPAGYLSIGHGNHSPSVTVSQGWLSAEAALAAAGDLAWGTGVDRVLLVCGDEADPAWTERIAETDGGERAALLAAEGFQEGAVALVLGREPGGRRIGTARAAVERAPVEPGAISALLGRYDALPGEGAEVRVRAGAGGGLLGGAVAAALGRPEESVRIDGPGPGTAQAAALLSLASHLRRDGADELLLVGAELDELAIVHWVR
jgi:hypothetical protein